MKHLQRFVLLAFLTVGIISLGLAATAHAERYLPHLLKGSNRKVCDVNSAKTVRCFAKVVANQSSVPTVTPLPAGYGPSQFHGAYQLPNNSTNPGTIAIVSVYDAPTITEDLATYNKTFGLTVFPNCSATVTKSCFAKVNQNGGTTYPQRSSGWALETALDVQVAHQTCQNCKLILVEASSANYDDLMKAVDRARLMGANVISGSWGSSEFSTETTYDSHFNYPGIAFVFSTGDDSYGATYPAASRYVTAVGGTTLSVTAANTWQSESIWANAGSGCSAYESKPTFQLDTACKKRTIADVTADADPNTGAAIYDSYGYNGTKGWFQLGGTSLSAPIVAGAYGLANNVGASVYANSLPYKKYQYGISLRDITVGNNGTCGSYLCRAVSGYDGPSGLGSIMGLGAF